MRFRCKNFGIFFIGLLLLLALVGCEGDPPETIKIGFVGCLTGICSDLGTSGRDGVLLAADEINKQGGLLTVQNDRRRIEIVSVNTRTSDGVFTVESFRGLVSQGVVAVVGPMTSQAGALLKPEADAAQTVLFSPTVSTTQLSGLDDFFFRVYPTCDLTAPALAQYALKIDGLKTFAIAYDEINVAFVDPWIDFFREAVVNGGGKIVGLQPLSDVRPMLKSAERVHGMLPDGVLVIGSAYETGLFIQQMKKLGSTARILGTEWSTAKGLEGYAGRALEESYFISSFDQGSHAENSLEFEKSYLARFNQVPTFAAKFGYEATILLLKALSKTPKGGDLRRSLKSLGPVPGLQTDLELDMFGDVNRGVYIKQFSDGSFKTVARYINKSIEITPEQ